MLLGPTARAGGPQHTAEQGGEHRRRLPGARGVPPLDRQAGTLGLLDRRPVGQHVAEHQRPEQLAELGDAELVLAVARPHAVDHHAQRLQVRVTALALGLDGVEGALYPGDGEHRRVGHQHRPLRGGQGAAGELAQRRRAVDDHQAVGLAGLVEPEAVESAGEPVELGGARVRPVVPLGLLGADQHVHPVSPAAGGDRPAHHRRGRLVEHVRDRGGGGRGVERHRGVGLRVQVDDESAHPVRLGGSGEAEGDRGLAHPALEAQRRDDQHGANLLTPAADYAPAVTTVGS